MCVCVCVLLYVVFWSGWVGGGEGRGGEGSFIVNILLSFGVGG